MPQQILALDIGDHEVRGVAVETSFRDYRVTGMFDEPAEGDRPLAERLRGFLERHGLEPDTVLVTIPTGLATQRTLRLPFRDKKKINQIVPFELETQVPFGLDDVIIDYQVLQRSRTGATVLAAMVQKSDLERHLSVLAEAGLDPKVVDFGPLCGLNLLTTIAKDLPETFAYVEVTRDEAAVALYRDKQLVGVRAISPPRPGEQNGAAPSLSPEALANELRWTLLVLNEGPLDPDLPCILAGEPGDHLSQVARAFSEIAGARVIRMESLTLRAVPGVNNGQAPAFARPLGLALREVSPTTSLGLNFRRGEFTYHRGQAEMRAALMKIGILAAVMIALMLTNLFVTYRLEQVRVAAIDEQIRNVFKATMPDTPPGSSPIGQLEGEIDTAQKRLGLLGDTAPVGNLTAIDVLQSLAAAVPAQTKIEVDEYIMDPDSVRVRGRTESFEAVDALKKHIGSIGYFREVQVKDSKARPDGTVEFRMILPLKKPGDGAEQ